jgi:hypothetical protein
MEALRKVWANGSSLPTNSVRYYKLIIITRHACDGCWDIKNYDHFGLIGKELWQQEI